MSVNDEINVIMFRNVCVHIFFHKQNLGLLGSFGHGFRKQQILAILESKSFISNEQ